MSLGQLIGKLLKQRGQIEKKVEVEPLWRYAKLCVGRRRAPVSPFACHAKAAAP